MPLLNDAMPMSALLYLLLSVAFAINDLCDEKNAKLYASNRSGLTFQMFEGQSNKTLICIINRMKMCCCAIVYTK